MNEYHLPLISQVFFGYILCKINSPKSLCNEIKRKLILYTSYEKRDNDHLINQDFSGEAS